MAGGEETPQEPEGEEPAEEAEEESHAELRRRLREVNAASQLNHRLNGGRSW
ncbi:hypothetical protein [Streptomyces sp. NBRC 109706]|uniref:hypothetical protein n=1 Tax=Streptomyces sp. NBRC 109706 TaxID=1550035 RepID=UPI000B1CED45|nr:hypothetical protein [Streptomyces sp. NBRC 109706]